MSDQKFSPAENARVAAFAMIPGVERAIDALQDLAASLRAIASPSASAAPKNKRKPQLILTDNHEQAVQRVLDGEKVTAIAHDLGVNPATIYSWAKRVRDGQPPPKPRSEYWTVERRKAKGRQIKAWRKRQKAKAAGG